MTDANAGDMPVMPAQHVSDLVQPFCAGPLFTPSIMLFNPSLKHIGANGPPAA